MRLVPAAVWIARKDLRAFFRDRTGVLLGFLLPIALVTVFGYIMQFAFGGEGGMPKVTLWVADGDGSALSKRFVAALHRSAMLNVEPDAGEKVEDAASLRAKVKDGAAHHALLIEPGFGAALAAGKAVPFTLVRDPGRRMESQVLGFALVPAFMEAGGSRTMPGLFAASLEKRNVPKDLTAVARAGVKAATEVMEEAFGGGDAEGETGSSGSGSDRFDMTTFAEFMVPIAYEDVATPARPKQLGYQLAQSVAGMSVMMLMFGLMACSSTLLVERDHGTLRRLLVARSPWSAIPLGKLFFCLVMGILQLLVLFAYGEALFGVGAFRDPVTLAGVSLTWAACATSFGMLIATWAKTQKQAEGLSVLLILVMAALGGCWFPVQIADLPWFADVATHATLTYWAMVAYQGTLWHAHDLTHPAMLQALGVQWGFTAVAITVSLWLFRRRYAGG